MTPARHDNLELGRSVSRRSRTSEAELQQEAVRWDSQEGRYLEAGRPESELEAAPDRGTATSTLVGDSAERSVDSRLGSHASSEKAAGEKAGGLGAAGGTSASAESRAGAGGGVEAPLPDSREPIWVEWEEGDVENPYNWSTRRRWLTTIIVCFNTFICSWCGASFGSGNPSMEADLGMGRELAALALAGFPFGFALAPLVLAPLSEMYGRKSMYTASTIGRSGARRARPG